MDDHERIKRKKSSSGRDKSRSGGTGRSGTQTKKRVKKKLTAEDALEAKMRAKSQRKKASSGKVEDALDAKIRRKNEAAAARAEARMRPADREEEKMEEGYSDYSDDDDNEGMAGYYDDHDYDRRIAAKGRGAGGVSSGVPVEDAPTDADGNALFTRGGGDVRNRPPQQKAPAIDPLRQAELDKQKNKKQLNPKFADLHETGQWGGLTKWEKYGICLLIVGAIVAAIVLGIRFGLDDSDKTPSPTSSPTTAPSRSPSASPTMAPTDDTYREAHGLELMIGSSPRLTLPQVPEALRGSKADADATPQELAAEFVLYDDPLEIPARDPRFLERYALAVFYFQNGGCSGDWMVRSNWLTDGDHCNATRGWHGVTCDLQRRVIELNLAENGVTGKVPVEFAGLLELSTLDLSNNALEGTVPAAALSMRNLYTIQLNNNLLTGEFPFEEVREGANILGERVVKGRWMRKSFFSMGPYLGEHEGFAPGGNWQPLFLRDNGVE